MTLMCQTQRPCLAQRLSILHRDQHFHKRHRASAPEISAARVLFSFCVYEEANPNPGGLLLQASLSRSMFQVAHDKAVSIEDLCKA